VSAEDREQAQMRQFIEQKAKEAGFPSFGEEKGFSEHFGDIQ